MDENAETVDEVMDSSYKKDSSGEVKETNDSGDVKETNDYGNEKETVDEVMDSTDKKDSSDEIKENVDSGNEKETVDEVMDSSDKKNSSDELKEKDDSGKEKETNDSDNEKETVDEDMESSDKKESVDEMKDKNSSDKEKEMDEGKDGEDEMKVDDVKVSDTPVETDGTKKSYGELSNEKDVIKNIEALEVSCGDIQNVIEALIEGDVYDKLGTEDKIKHDLFVSYALTSLYWMYTRTLGEDPYAEAVKTETDRVQDYMKKYQRIKDRKTAPSLHKEAAKRFIKSGLWDPRNAPSSSNKRKIEED